MSRPAKFPASLSQWIVTNPPAGNSGQWSAANHSKLEWKVWLREGDGEDVGVELYDTREPYTQELPFIMPEKLDVERHLNLFMCDWARARRCFTAVNNGWIVGFDRGEFGGSLCWFSPDASDSYGIVRGNIKDLFHTEVGLLALKGLAHLVISRGQILQLAQSEDGVWTASQFFKLPHAPEVALLQEDGSLLVATTKELLVIHSNKNIDVLLRDAFWGGLYPNSIVRVASGTIYLGMRHGVARVQQNDTGYKVDWLLPNETFVKAKHNRQLQIVTNTDHKCSSPSRMDFTR